MFDYETNMNPAIANQRRPYLSEIKRGLKNIKKGINVSSLEFQKTFLATKQIQIKAYPL